jgi:nicotinate phosphoribosyltransferase
MAHSFVMNYDSEQEAFEKFSKVFPSNPAVLVDTYDTLEGAKRAAAMTVAPSLVRLDSGDRYDLSLKVRRILDEAGLKKTKIFVSGDLNELVIDELTSRGAPIDGFGVGTELVTSRDDPAIQGIYKIVATKRNGKTSYRVKTSEDKRTIPGAKQVYRTYSTTGEIEGDIIALSDEEKPLGAEPLLTKIIHHGKLIRRLPKIDKIRDGATQQIARLPAKYKDLRTSEEPPVKLSQSLEKLTESLYNNPNQK